MINPGNTPYKWSGNSEMESAKGQWMREEVWVVGIPA